MDCASNLPGQQVSDEMARRIGERLVRTFLTTLQVIVQFRHRAQGLLLSELGAYVLSSDQAPTDTKQLGNLLRSNKWASKQIQQFLWRDAHETLNELEAEGDDPLLVWDESVIEKAESIAIAGFAP